MSERLVSPGVFTQENDLSFLPQGVAQIGAAFVGPTLKGPAFRPVIVESQDDFERTFGTTDPSFYTPYAVQNYLREASRATVVRILGLNGYDSAVNKSLVLQLTSGSTTVTVAVLHPSQVGVTLPTGSIGAQQTPTQFTLVVSGTSGLTTYNSMSINPTSAQYFGKVLGFDPRTNQDAFVYADFPTNASTFVSGSLVGSGSMKLVQVTGELNFSGSTWGVYSNAHTPWIRSQTVGSVKYNLFRFWTLTDGGAANNDVKISITGIKPAIASTDYGTFTVLVRQIDDTDSKIQVLEQFDNLTLDPNSPDYIARRIGTARTMTSANGDVFLEGDWPNNSQYVYTDMATGIEAVPNAVLPYGFAAPAVPVARNDVPAPDYVTTRYYTPTGATTAVSNDKVYFGFDFTSEDSLSYLKALPSGSSTTVGLIAVGTTSSADTGFDLSSSLSSTDQTDLLPASATSLRKFTVPFQGGFDGQNFAVVRSVGGDITATNTQGYDLSDSSKPGARAYKQAIDALSNKDAFDINLLVMPGVIYSLHPYIVAQGISLCENRGDCFYVLNGSVLTSTTATAINDVQGLDTSYAADYYPWIKVRDVSTNKVIWVPPDVLIPSVYAFNDRIGAEWFAPAGLNRGGIGEALQVRSRLSQSDRDVLYEGRVNPIASFPGQGITVWGQKTLQVQASALDRINVRRLLITMKKFIASTSRYLVFEQNVEATRNRFLSIVNPYCASIQERNGLYAFKVKMDETNNTPDIIDRNILVGDLFLQPTKTSEFIMLTFNVLPTGATFPA